MPDFNIIYEDNHLLVVNKPAGMLVQGDKTKDKTILDLYKTYIKEKYDKPGAVFLGLPHRLDRPTSGTLVLCRTSKSLSRITEQFRNGQVIKVYHALVSKTPKESSQRLQHYLRKDSKLNKVHLNDNAKAGYKKAILDYKYYSVKGRNTLLEINLLTGRPHQIRAQLSHIGSPIIGDLKYGFTKALPDKSIGLHCKSIIISHPTTKETLTFSAEYPNKPWWRAH